jgi:hypothetical protein
MKKAPILETLMPETPLRHFSTVYVPVWKLDSKYLLDLAEHLDGLKIGKGSIKILVNDGEIYRIEYVVENGKENTQKPRMLEVREMLHRGIEDWIRSQPDYKALYKA